MKLNDIKSDLFPSPEKHSQKTRDSTETFQGQGQGRGQENRKGYRQKQGQAFKVESECEQYCCPAHFQVSWGLAQIARDCQHVPADTALPRVDNYHFAIFGLDPDLCLNALGIGP